MMRSRFRPNRSSTTRVSKLSARDVVVADVALFLEQARDVHLHARRGHLDRVLQRLVGVADAGEHVGDGIGQHVTPLPRALGHARDRAPSWASSPQANPAFELLEDRPRPAATVAPRVLGTGNRGVRAALAISDSSFPPCPSRGWPANGNLSAQQRESLLVGRRRRRDRDVEVMDGRDVVVEADLREDDLLSDAERVVATAVERPELSPRKSRMRGRAIEMRRSRKSYMRSPRSVTRAPIGIPSRILKPAIDLRARRTRARCPAMRVSSSIALSSAFALGLGLADAHVQRHLRHAVDLHDGAQAQLVLELAAELVAA